MKLTSTKPSNRERRPFSYDQPSSFSVRIQLEMMSHVLQYHTPFFCLAVGFYLFTVVRIFLFIKISLRAWSAPVFFPLEK
jgi:hypothetical protein